MYDFHFRFKVLGLIMVVALLCCPLVASQANAEEEGSLLGILTTLANASKVLGLGTPEAKHIQAVMQEIIETATGFNTYVEIDDKTRTISFAMEPIVFDPDDSVAVDEVLERIKRAARELIFSVPPQYIIDPNGGQGATSQPAASQIGTGTASRPAAQGGGTISPDNEKRIIDLEEQIRILREQIEKLRRNTPPPPVGPDSDRPSGSGGTSGDPTGGSGPAKPHVPIPPHYPLPGTGDPHPFPPGGGSLGLTGTFGGGPDIFEIGPFRCRVGLGWREGPDGPGGSGGGVFGGAVLQLDF